MWIVAGPNGAGKSTFASRLLEHLGHRDLLKLNADERTLELLRHEPDTARATLNLRAAQYTDREVEQCIRSGRRFLGFGLHRLI